MAGFPLTGIDPNDPIPGIIREIRFQQGASSGSGNSRPVVLLENKVASGSETVDTLGAPILDETDCIARFGYRSAILLMYRKYVAVDPGATVYAIGVAEGGGSAAASRTITFATTATAVGTVEVHVLGETATFGVQIGDTPTVMATNCAAAINAQIYWPVTASPSAGVVTVTCANKGPRHGVILSNTLHVKLVGSFGSTATLGSLTAGTGSDDYTNAYTQLQSADIYYQVTGCTSPDGVGINATDNGIGEHADLVKQQSLPTFGKSAIMCMALVTDSTISATVGLALNNVRCVIFHAKNAEWTTGMIAAHYAAAKRSREIAHPGANLTHYGLKGADVSNLPDPWTKTDRLSTTEIRSDLNNGVTPIAHTMQGQAYLVRQITAACQVNAQYDYRAREGHIPSCADYFWDSVKTSYTSQQQDFVADDLQKGQKPLENVQYPASLKGIITTEIDRAIAFSGGPYLDPSLVDQMKASVAVVRLNDGLSARCAPVAVKHNNKGQFLLLESSAAY